MAIKRRTLLAGAAATAAATAIGSPKGWTQSVPMGAGGKGVQLPYKLYTIGTSGERYAGEKETLGLKDPDLGGASIAIEVDLMTRKARFFPYDMSEGHWPLVLPDGRLFVTSRFKDQATFLSPDGEVLKAFRLKQFDGLNFGGHSIYDAKHDRIISTVTSPIYGDDAKGFVCVTDAKTMDLVGMMPIKGTNNSHELRFLPKGDGIVVTGYGKHGNYQDTMDIVKSGWNFLSVENSVLSVLDPVSLEVLRQYPSPNKYPMGHMDVDPDGNVYIEQQRSLAYDTSRIPVDADGKNKDEDGYGRMTWEILNKLVEGYEKEIGGKRKWPLHISESPKRGMTTPTSILKINAYTGATEELWQDPHNHRYVQSIAYHPDLKAIFAVSRHSDALMVFPTDGSKPFGRSSLEFGIYTACGVCAFPGTPYIGMLSHYSGMAIVDATSMTVVDYLPVPTFKAVHLNAVRVI